MAALSVPKDKDTRAAALIVIAAVLILLLIGRVFRDVPA